MYGVCRVGGDIHGVGVVVAVVVIAITHAGVVFRRLCCTQLLAFMVCGVCVMFPRMVFMLRCLCCALGVAVSVCCGMHVMMCVLSVPVYVPCA